jgi:hypothetical protein
MKRYTVIIIVLLSPFFFTAIFLSQCSEVAVGNREENKYRREFLKIPDVKEVIDFMYHEGHTAVTLRLRDETRLHIWDFNDSTFINTDNVELDEINELSVVCDLKKNMSGWASGFNTIEFIQMKKPSLPIHIKNLQELLVHRDMVYELFDSLPKCVERAERLDFKRRPLWCIVVVKHRPVE